MNNNDIHPAPSQFTEAQLDENPILRFFHYAHLPEGFRETGIMEDPMLRLFHYMYLPEGLQETSIRFCHLAHYIVNNLPRNAERTVALRKLLEAKDAAVRANLPPPADTFDQKTTAVASEDNELLKAPHVDWKTTAVASEDTRPLDDPMQIGKLDDWGEPKEIGGHDEDRDGPIPFDG